MDKQNIIVIGASAGGFEALKKIVSVLPPDLDAAIFIVWHMAPTIRGVLPQVLSKISTIPAAHAVDGEPIIMNRIYVAPPDHHMLLEQGHIRVTRGPKENRFRPAVDPLFRSAAYAYGNRVIGVVLSGALDDGTAGLWSIKYRGGVAVVQDPDDSEVSSMPESAISQVAVNYVVPLAEIGPLLTKLAGKPAGEKIQATMQEDDKTKTEIKIAAEDTAAGINIFQYGQLSPYACPECHGVLTLLKDGNISRFRCHTGHAYSADALLDAITEKIEDSLYSAIRGVDESMLLLNHIGDHFAEANHKRLAAQYFQKAQLAQQRSELVRQAVMLQTQLGTDELAVNQDKN
ncbi:chemotaxis protein CheB [Dyadobacter chenwenxiniae]|uniref:protein-glutamate methylesterase n=1 Tax=Dyadobacter chenwenxiniae TaxID=2906456 RepID=A0A9X1PK74_9BACT|nr:chemotaxis protein CheB [Dyadobacter chenwenxiniae]MCF0062837.1 chemotaxis protein CheB [Dyadobacter chenwenxiniae]UON84988.1 chemotaxis protein CheB [Dyadobacter chenwenxiniae]